MLGSPVDVIDDYLPESGNLGTAYRAMTWSSIPRRTQPPTGVATITATATSHVKQVQLDLARRWPSRGSR